MVELLYKELTFAVIGAAMEVHIIKHKPCTILPRQVFALPSCSISAQDLSNIAA